MTGITQTSVRTNESAARAMFLFMGILLWNSLWSSTMRSALSWEMDKRIRLTYDRGPVWVAGNLNFARNHRTCGRTWNSRSANFY
jgi:hypothetical protein